MTSVLWVLKLVNGKGRLREHMAPHGEQGEIQLALNEKGNLNINELSN